MTMLAQANRIMLPQSMPTAVVFFMAAAAVAAWVGTHAVQRFFSAKGVRWAQVAMFAFRVLVGAGAIFLVGQAAQRVLVLATSWPIWPIALLGSLCVELLLFLYGLERRSVSRRSGLALVAMRVALVLLVVLMLTQPVKSLALAKKFLRCVAVLVDDSASMHIPETQLTPAEKVRQAEMLGLIDRPCHPERIHEGLSKARTDLAAQHEMLRSLDQFGGRDVGKELAGRVGQVNKALKAAKESVDEQVKALSEMLVGKLNLDGATSRELSNLKATLALRVQGRLQDVLRITEDDDAGRLGAQNEKLKTDLGQAVAALAECLPKLQDACEQIDATCYRSLPPQQRKKVDGVADRTRYELAREVLLRKGALRNPQKGARSDKALLDQLGDGFEVKLYTFAAKLQSVDAKRWRETPATMPSSKSAADLPAEQQETNIAAALKDLMTQLRGKDLAGVILLTDGRQNAPGRVEDLAHDLGAQHVPVCSVAFGSSKPPRDAAVVSIDPPETVYAGDKVSVKTELKLDGLAGEAVKVVLYDGDKPVADELIAVPKDQDRLRKKIELAAEPKDAGQHRYSVRIQGAEGKDIPDEVFTGNNQFDFTVTVTRDRTKLLIVEGRPRWEFRYIKNLFDGRDRTVQLQYVLLEPDQIQGQPPRPEVRASVSRPQGQSEATALPKDLEEWLKFDVIILGDVSPEHLGPDAVTALGKFVRDRGGTLVIIAGPRFMPQAYAESGMEDILPVEMIKPAPGRTVMESGDPSFHIALTSEGRDNVILRQNVDPKENQAIWDAVPDIYWRYPGAALKGTTVLAYAMPPNPPEVVKKSAGGEADDKDQTALREFERRRALMTVRRLEPGKVMFLSFDRTWRLRYRVGDTYHHKLWGQILRWATAEKLPSGTDLVKIGTERSRYSPRQSVRVRVKIVRPDFSPVVSEEVAVNVFVQDKRVLRRKLQFVPDSPGIYTADLGELPTGAYTVELDAPVAKPLLERDNVEKVAVSFSVDPAAAPAEQIELAADRGLLNRLATQSEGIMTAPLEAYQLLDVLAKHKDKAEDTKPREYLLWNSWPLLLLIVLIATGEWLLRKKVGLA